ncbi:dTDP-4-dehydrorhamnose 3,5-epimerase family protein [Candidatus Sumerlaeota bacterium]|nr:dTDP-4-dehydrorhamnose 3,5-epimerase family protein [Candidatus Sumerlaeota bacterium]
MNIGDVLLVPLTVHEDDRGYLFEMAHKSDPFVSGAGVEIRQVYCVGDRIERIVRAFHKHDQLHDWFCIVKGSAKFVLVDDRPDSKTYRKADQVVCSDRAPKLLVVPPGVYHGWMSLEPDTVMISTASHEYNRERPDEYRVPPTAFNDLLGGDPWEIKGK